MTIHSRLEAASFYLCRVASGGRLRGENEDRLLERAIEELAAASGEYSHSKLLFSDSLANKIDQFFDKYVSARLDLDLIKDPMLQDPAARARLWDALRHTVFRQLMELLGAIRTESKVVIHGRTPQTTAGDLGLVG